MKISDLKPLSKEIMLESEVEHLQIQVSKLISIIDNQDNSLLKKQRRLDTLTSNVVDATYHANTVKKLNDHVEALGLDIYYMNQSIYNANSKLEQSESKRESLGAEFNEVLKDRDNSTEVILQLQKENEYWKREAEKNLSRYEDSLKSNEINKLREELKELENDDLISVREVRNKIRTNLI